MMAIPIVINPSAKKTTNANMRSARCQASKQKRSRFTDAPSSDHAEAIGREETTSEQSSECTGKRRAHLEDTS